MTKLDLRTLIYGLATTLAIGCGDANVADHEEDPNFGEETADQLDDQHEEDTLNDDEEDEELPVEEEDEEPLPEPFCGDGVVDEGEGCDDGNDVDGDSCSSLCEVEPEVLETQGQIDLLLTVDDLNSNAAPAEASCSDALAVLIEDGALTFEGTCFLPANFIDVIGSGVVAEDGTIEGEIVFVLNNRDNVISFEGTFVDQVLEIDFLEVTPIVGSIRGIWDGTVDANFE